MARTGAKLAAGGGLLICRFGGVIVTRRLPFDVPVQAPFGKLRPMIDTAQEIAQLRALLAEREAELASARAELTGAKLLIEQYKAQLAKLRRMQFASLPRSSTPRSINSN